MNTSKVKDEETINFIYNSEFIEKHAKPNSALDLSDKNFFHPLLKEIDKNQLTYMEYAILKKIKKLGFIKSEGNKFIAKRNYGFPRLLCHIHDERLQILSRQNNPEHYLSTCNLPPPLCNYLHTLNNIQVSDVIDKEYNKIAAVKILGNYPDTHKPIVFGNNKNTLFAATKRAQKIAPVPDDNVVKDFIEHCKTLIDKDIGTHLDHFSYNYAQWYNHLPAKKQKLIKPMYEFFNKPSHLHNNGVSKKAYGMTYLDYDKLLDESYQAICKAELEERDGKPRMVCAIPQIYKYAMGPVTWKLEEICSKYLKGYCGSKNLSEMEDMINEYADRGFTKVVEGDGSAFDNTQDITLKELDRYLYSKVKDSIYHIPKNLFYKISQSYYKKMRVKVKNEKIPKELETFITYYVLGSVFSGDCDTTLCNTLRMAMYNRYVNDKFGLVYDRDYVVFSKGDDFSVLYKPYVSDEKIKEIYYTFFLPPSDGPDTVTDARQYGLGQILKFLTIGDLNTFKFCSLRSWYKDMHGHVYLTRDPAKLYYLSKYSIKYKTYNHLQRLQYNFDLMLSYLINYPNIDIFTSIAAAHAKKFLELYNTISDENYDFCPYRIMLYRPDGMNTNLTRNRIEDNNSLFDKYIVFFDQEKNEKFYKIDDNYWETIKRLTQVHNLNYHLSPMEVQYINEQINSEFDYQYILNDNDIRNIDEAKQLCQEVFTLKNKYYAKKESYNNKKNCKNNNKKKTKSKKKKAT